MITFFLFASTSHWLYIPFSPLFQNLLYQINPSLGFSQQSINHKHTIFVSIFPLGAFLKKTFKKTHQLHLNPKVFDTTWLFLSCTISVFCHYHFMMGLTGFFLLLQVFYNCMFLLQKKRIINVIISDVASEKYMENFFVCFPQAKKRMKCHKQTFRWGEWFFVTKFCVIFICVRMYFGFMLLW